jgi:ABC-type sugar transport system ATPase subunit
VASIRLQNVTKLYRGRAEPTLLFDPPLTVSPALIEAIGARTSPPPGVGEPTVALDDVTLTVDDGRTLAVVGPTGCGKTTLLRVVAGLEIDFTGRVFYDGTDVTNVPVRDRHIGMVFQNYALYPHFEGQGNLAFFFKVRRAPDEETEERIRVTSEVMGLGFRELLGRKPGKLSGGEQQRLAIARAIVRRPELFLFDEPLSNLDAKLRERTRAEIKRLLHRFAITAIYVTHDQNEAIALGDEIAVMRAGRIEQVGRCRQLLESPANAFVAGFFGKPPMNLLAARRVSQESLEVGQATVPLPDVLRHGEQSGERVIVGVRPEAARLRPPGEGEAGSVFIKGVVDVVEPDFGQRTKLVYVRAAAGTCAVLAPLDDPVAAGDEVEVALPIGELYFFEGDDGRLAAGPAEA